MYIAYSDKLMNLAEDHAREIAEQWYKTVTTNPKTRSYRKVSKYKLVNEAENFYRYGKTLYFAQSAYDAATAYFTAFAENQIYENIPLDEAVYALIMLKKANVAVRGIPSPVHYRPRSVPGNRQHQPGAAADRLWNHCGHKDVRRAFQAPHSRILNVNQQLAPPRRGKRP